MQYGIVKLDSAAEFGARSHQRVCAVTGELFPLHLPLWALT